MCPFHSARLMHSPCANQLRQPAHDIFFPTSPLPCCPWTLHCRNRRQGCTNSGATWAAGSRCHPGPLRFHRGHFRWFPHPSKRRYRRAQRRRRWWIQCPAHSWWRWRWRWRGWRWRRLCGIHAAFSAGGRLRKWPRQWCHAGQQYSVRRPTRSSWRRAVGALHWPPYPKHRHAGPRRSRWRRIGDPFGLWTADALRSRTPDKSLNTGTNSTPNQTTASRAEWWTLADSNRRPRACEARALTN